MKKTKIALLLSLFLVSVLPAVAWHFPPRPTETEIAELVAGMRAVRPDLSNEELTSLARAGLISIWRRKTAQSQVILDRNHELESGYVPGSDYGQ